MLHAIDRQWLCFFPILNSIHTSAWNKMLENVIHLKLNAGQMVFRDGESCQNYLLVLSGIVRVQKISQDGHEITLYRLRTGEACEITTTCLLANDYYHAEAIAESDVTAVLIPKYYFQIALTESPEFRNYVYKNVEEGINVLLSLIEDVAFGPIDTRLAKDLILNKNHDNEVFTTHHEIASNLGTAREVVSRILKKFEKKSWVKLQRGKITILNPQAVSNLAESLH